MTTSPTPSSSPADHHLEDRTEDRVGDRAVKRTERHSLRIALLGSRGIPARYGGYETFMEQLAKRLVQRGHQVTVYCRSHYTSKTETQVDGVRLAVLPTLRTKYLDTPVHSLLSCFHAIVRRYDVALMVNAANTIFVPILRAGFIPTALHVDGLEQERAKWGALGRLVYQFSERLATLVPTRLVTDATAIQQHFEQRHGAASTMIPYGSDLEPATTTEILDTLGLTPGSYFLYVSRFERENNPHRVVQAFRASNVQRKLVMLGDAPYADEFIRSFVPGPDSPAKDATNGATENASSGGIRNTGSTGSTGSTEVPSDDRIIFPGALYGRAYRELQTHAYAYIQATEVGGTHPALVEAMGFGNCILLNDVPENREVAGDAALLFRSREPQTLTDLLNLLDSDAETVKAQGLLAQARAQQCYSWEAVTDAYEELFLALSGKSI